ncbi:MAG: outer membrane protein assembly factor BamB family protein [Polyangia bacterium]
MRQTITLVAAIAVAAGCRTRPLDFAPDPAAGAPRDMAALVDLAAAFDFGMRDLATHDLATQDLAPTHDLAAPRDLATPTDLASPADLAGADLSWPNSDGGIDDGGCGIVVPTGSTATSYQIDPAHDGVQPRDRIALPLCKRWLAPISGSLSYPVVANGRVFVTASDTPSYGTRLYALDERTGAALWGPVELGGTYFWSALGWDADIVFAVNGDGLLRAFRDDTGALLWQASNASTLFTASAPVAADGRVYVANGSGFTVFDGATGGILWSASAATANHMTPAVAGSTIFVTRGCSGADAFDILTNAQLWHTSSSCTNYGGGGAAVFGGGELYARSFYQDTEVYDGATGTPWLTYTADRPPAVAATVRYLVTNGGDVQAIAKDQLTPIWTFAGQSAVTAPVLAGDTVIVAGDGLTGVAGTLWLLDATTGSVRASIALPGNPYGPDEWNYSTPLAGLTVADGLLFVPTSAGLIAY